MHPHDERPYSFCPMCGGELEPRAIKQNEPERLVCVRCGFVFYLDPKVAVGTIISDEQRPHRPGAARHRARLRQVGVPGRLRGPRRAGEGRGRPRGTGGIGASRPARPPDQRVFLSGPRAGGHRLRGDRSSAARCAPTTSASTRACSRPHEIPWDDLAFPSTHDALREYPGRHWRPGAPSADGNVRGGARRLVGRLGVEEDAPAAARARARALDAHLHGPRASGRTSRHLTSTSTRTSRTCAGCW